MARNSNSSKIYLFDFGLNDNSMYNHFRSPNSNLRGDYADGSDSFSSQVLSSNSIVEVHQNNIIPQSGDEALALGQLGLSQRLTSTRRTYVTPNRVQVHSSIEYFPRKNIQINYPNEVIITEVVRTTKFLTSTPMIEPLLISYDNVCINSQCNFQNQKLPLSNPLIRLTTNCEPYLAYLQKSNTAENQLVIGLENHVENEGDGRTHSLPHKKYGPYTCPRCKLVFTTSQSFAGHMLTHYKYESSEQRKKRLKAKYKSKNLHLVHQHGALTVLPLPSKKYISEKKSCENPLAIENNVENNTRRGQGNVEAIGKFYSNVMVQEKFTTM